MDFYKNLSAGFVGQASGVNTGKKVEETERPSTDELLEGQDMTKMMGMFQEIMSSDPNMKQKADSLWKFLDDLHKTNPKEYYSFISKHISEGKEEMKKEQEKELLKEGIQSDPVLCMKLKLFELKTGHKDAAEGKMDIKLFAFESSEELKSSDDKPIEKHLAKPCIYLNICMSEKVKGPLDQNRKYADASDDKTWAIIPVSFSKESDNEDQIIYDAHLNKSIIERGIADKRVMNSVLVVVLKKFEQLMINKYRIDTKDVHILGNRKYKGLDLDKTKPDLHLLMPDCDPKLHEEMLEKMKKLQQKDLKMPTIHEEEKEEINAEDLLKKLNLPGSHSSSKESSKPKVTEVTGLPVSKPNIVPKEESKTVKKGETQIKETVIKSIDDYNTEEKLKKLQKQDKKEPSVKIDFGIEHKKGNIRLKISLPLETSAAGIDLLFNESGFLLESDHYYWEKTFQKYHPNLKAIKVFNELGEKGPKTQFSKSKNTLTVYLTEK